KFFKEKRESFLDYITPTTVILLQNTEVLTASLNKSFAVALDEFAKLNSAIKHIEPAQLFIDGNDFLKRAELFSVAEFSLTSYYESKKVVEFFIQPQPAFNKQFDLLLNDLSQNHSNGIKNYLC